MIFNLFPLKGHIKRNRHRNNNMGKCIYKLKCQKNVFPWIQPINGDKYCKHCMESFHIDCLGICQVRSHTSSASHRNKNP